MLVNTFSLKYDPDWGVHLSDTRSQLVIADNKILYAESPVKSTAFKSREDAIERYNGNRKIQQIDIYKIKIYLIGDISIELVTKESYEIDEIFNLIKKRID